MTRWGARAKQMSLGCIDFLTAYSKVAVETSFRLGTPPDQRRLAAAIRRNFVRSLRVRGGRTCVEEGTPGTRAARARRSRESFDGNSSCRGQLQSSARSGNADRRGHSHIDGPGGPNNAPTPNALDPKVLRRGISYTRMRRPCVSGTVPNTCWPRTRQRKDEVVPTGCYPNTRPSGEAEAPAGAPWSYFKLRNSSFQAEVFLF